MSFDYNPYKHIEVVNDNGYRIVCHSCGGTRPKRNDSALPFTTTVVKLFEIMAEHVSTSHERDEEFFEQWNIY